MANTTDMPADGEPKPGDPAAEPSSPDPISADPTSTDPSSDDPTVPPDPGSATTGPSGAGGEGPPPIGGPAPTPPKADRSARSTTDLRRPKEGRWVAGVAAGIADRLGVERWVIRLAFILLSAGGGSGVLLYIAAWLLIPEEGESASVGQRWANQANSTRPWVGVVLVVVAAAILFSNFPFFDGGLLFPTALLVIGILLYRGDLPGIDWKPKPPPNPTTANPNMETTTAMTTPSDSFTITQQVTPLVVKPRTPPSPLGRITVGATVIGLGLMAAIDRISPQIDAQPRHYFALAIVTLGLGTLIGSYYGKARWLIPIGLLLVPAMIGASIADAADGTWRTPQVVRPSQFAGLVTTYDKDAGELVIDLTGLPWQGESITLDAELGVGVLDLRVPAGVRVEATGDVGIGEFATGGDSHGGFGVGRTFIIEGNGAGTVLANLQVGIGQILVDTDRDRFFNGDEIGKPEPFGDLVVNVDSPEALEPSYTTSDGDITLDLAGLTLDVDRMVEVSTDFGDINVTLPVDASYRVVARTDTGVVDLFGEDRIDRGGTVRADSITAGQPVIELNIQSIDGDIILTQGERE